MYTHSAKFCHHEHMTDTREVSLQTTQVMETWKSGNINQHKGRKCLFDGQNISNCQHASENQNKVLKCELQGLVFRSDKAKGVCGV